MGMKNFFEVLSRTPSLEDGAEISLKDALKYGKDEKYQKYIFSPEERNGETVFIVHINEPKKEVKEEQQEEKSEVTLETSKPMQKTKTKRNQNFIDSITRNGKCKGIDKDLIDRKKLIESRMDRGQQTRQYGVWQKSKRYNPDQFIK